MAETEARPSVWRTFLPALLIALASILTAPFLGLVRNALFEAFPRGFVLFLGVLFGCGFLGVLAFGAWRVRKLGKRAFLGLVLLFGLVALQALVFNRGIPRVDIVEKVHFIQYGLLSLFLYRAVRHRCDLSMVAVPVLGTLITGSLEEWVQWLVPLRVGEVLDVALNLYAGVCGLVLGWTLYPPREFRLQASFIEPPRLTCLAVAGVLSFGLFFHFAHLGYLLQDADIGEFRSWHSMKHLQERSETYRELWSQKPPRLDRVLAIENRFATEAGWHVSARNGAYGRGDFCTALKENEILEKYYRPFLTLPDGDSGGTRSLSLDQKRELAEKTAGTCPKFRSHALENRIETRISKLSWWALMGSLLAIVLMLVGVARKAGKDGSSGGT